MKNLYCLSWKNLPDKFSYDALEEVGTEAKKNTSSNDLGIESKFYKNRLKKSLETSQRVLSGIYPMCVSTNTMICNWLWISLLN